MINAGQYNKLIVERETENGLYLVDDDRENEVLLPNRYVGDLKEGDCVNVFVYFDSEDRPVATTDTPLIQLEQVRSLKVVATTKIGAFLDWGLPKDILVPFRNQLNPMIVGDYHPVTIYLDKVTGRIVGTSKIGYLINNNGEITVKQKEEVEIIVAQRRERGFRVIINQKHWGMLYDNQIFEEVNIGDTLKAFVSKISDDNRIDVCLQQQGFDQVKVSVDALRQAIEENNGVVECGDKSEPELIQATLGMSKKVFKKAAGVLLRGGEIVIEDFKIKKL